MALIVVIDCVHFGNGIKVPNDERRLKGSATLDRSPANFFNHADVTPLVAPGFLDGTGLKRHARQPRAVLARSWIAKLIGANESLGNALILAAVEKLCIGWEILEECV